MRRDCVLLWRSAFWWCHRFPSSRRVDLGLRTGEWRYLGGDAAHTRYSPLDQIDARNFEDLEVAWIWRADNFGPTVDYAFKSTPSYVDGMLYTVASERRQVVAIDPATGKPFGSSGSPTPYGLSAPCGRTMERESRTRRSRAAG